MINVMEKKFLNVHSKKDVILFVSLILAGAICLLLPLGSYAYIVSFLLITLGVFLAFVLKSEYKEVSSGDRCKKKELFFHPNQKIAIQAAIVSNPEAIEPTVNMSGNSIKLDIYYSSSAKKAYLQLFEYMPHRYEACSEVYVHDIDSVKTLIL